MYMQTSCPELIIFQNCKLGAYSSNNFLYVSLVSLWIELMNWNKAIFVFWDETNSNIIEFNLVFGEET